MALLNDSDLTIQERTKIVNTVRGKLPVDYSTELTIIPVEFEERSSRIPVVIRDEEHMDACFDEIYSHSVQEIFWAHYDPNGQSTGYSEINEAIMANQKVFLDYDGRVYSLTSHNNVFYFESLEGNVLYELILNDQEQWTNTYQILVTQEQLNAHINNTTVHITQDERLFWNNKLNITQLPSNGNLTFDRN